MRRLCKDCKKSEKCSIKKNLMNYAVKASIKFMLIDCDRHNRASTPLLIKIGRAVKKDVNATVEFTRKTLAMFCTFLSAQLFNLGIVLLGEEEEEHEFKDN